MTHQVCCPGFCQRYVASSLTYQSCASAQELWRSSFETALHCCERFCGVVQVVNMPLQQFRDLYREYINAFAACMLELASDPESPVLPRLERLVRLKWDTGSSVSAHVCLSVS